MAKKFDISLTLSAVDRMTQVINTAVNNGVSKFNRLKKTADGIARSSANFAQQAGAMGLAAGAAIALPIKNAVDFEQAMARTGAITRANKEQMDALTASARLMGKTTQFTAMQAAEAQKLLGMAGFKTNEIIGALPNTLNLAASANVSLADAAGTVTGVLGGLGKTYEDLGGINDILVNTFTSSKTSLQTLGETLKFSAKMATDAGVDFNVLAAMAGKLGDASIDASMAGTAIRSMISSLAGPTGPAKKAIESLGLKVADQEGNFRPMLAILDDISKATAKMGTQKRLGILTQIFGREASGAVLTLLSKSGGELAKYADSLTKAGTANKVAAKQMETARGAMLLFESASQDLFITVGNTLLPALTQIVKDASAVVNVISGWAEKNPELAKTIAVITAGFSALMLTLSGAGFVVSGVASLFSTLAAIGPVLASAIGFITTAVRAMSAAMYANPIGLIIGAIVLGAYLIYEYWEPISNFFAGVFSDIEAAFDRGFLEGVMEVLKTLNPLFWIAKAFNAVVDYFFGIDLYEAGANIIEGLWQGMQDHAISVVNKAKEIGDSISSGFKSVLGIESPSKVFVKHGINIARGAEIGMNTGGLATGAGTASARAIAPNLQTSPIAGNSGTVSVNYSPTVNIGAGGSEAQKADFLEMLRNHERELMNMIYDAKARNKRLSF